MILLTILAIIAFFLIGFLILTISAGGAIFIIVFADVIVCVLVIIWLIKKLIGRKKK